MGRPVKNNPRDRQLNFSLTAEELATLQARADAVGMRLVDYGRGVLLKTRRSASSANNSVRPPSKLERLNNIQLRRVGNNLNQLVHWHHRYRQPLPARLEPLLAEIRQLIQQAGP
ncbi:hypothetical protein HNR60_003317 [Rhodopseudomonas rhenobacensis]|uniref:Mobilisation protein (MobC) n=1 Tax=Rhodopseudomonas rhenobacensis TaxID=87461 RepID=A0A7W7Z5T1_9BRAD|nr:plasmid mobilization relaxosome protein MobC [Rhodopseudomonas rhenobacensis]MBB5048550.1 hypothetical protein [Rhodopseudomonas rhenobacensis]